MINKKNIWFLTLFSLILVLSVYYITMPNELLLKNMKIDSKEPVVEIKEDEVLSALRIESDEVYLEELDSLKLVLTDDKKTKEEKNEAFEKMKALNINKTEEKNLESKIKEEYELNSFIKINNDQIKIVIDSKKHDKSLANTIMRFIQGNYDTKKYITVEFK